MRANSGASVFTDKPRRRARAVRCLGLLAVCVMGCGLSTRRAPSPTANGPAVPSFDCRVLPGTVQQPFGVIAGDWNRDGRIDLAVSSAGEGTVTSYVNRGRRTYEIGSRVKVGKVTRAMATGDVNADGFIDIAAANAQPSTATVLFGDGAGGFAVGSQNWTGLSPFGTALGDLDGDGMLDLVVANESNTPTSLAAGAVTVLYGKRGGGFSPPVTLSAGSHPAAVQIADLDGQRGPDLAVVNWESATVSIFLNNGDRTFQHAAEVAYGGRLPYSLWAGDLDGDGAVDLAVTDIPDEKLWVLFGDGHGGFPRQASSHIGRGARWVTGADVNGDGVVDLLTADTSSNTVSLLLGRGHGEFAPAVAIPVGPQPRGVLAADLDGDGLVDLAVTNGGGGDVWLLYQTRGKGTPCGGAAATK